MKVNTTIIVAYNHKRTIGNDGKLIWHYSEDMKHFKNVTYSHAVIMGRKTWDSLPNKNKPLPGRLNIVITRDSQGELEKYQEKIGMQSSPSPYFTNSLEMGILHAYKSYTDKKNPIFIIGGGEIYRMALEKGIVGKIIATEVKERSTVEGDTTFPEIADYFPNYNRRLIKRHSNFDIVEYTKVEINADKDYGAYII